MRVLVTGGSGFLGGYVLAEATRRGYHCVALARSDAAARIVADRGAEPARGDLGESVGLGEVFAAACCDALVNLASLGFGHAPAIVEAARVAGISRGVFISTTAVTTSLSARTKQVRLDAEQLILQSGMKWTILRPTMIYGAPEDRNLSRLLTVLHRVLVVPVPGGGQHLQQPVHVADLAGAVLAALERPAAAGTIYDVAGPMPLMFADLLQISAHAVNSRARFVPVPLVAAVTAARCYERLGRRFPISAEQLQRLAEDKAFAIDDAVRDLGYAPRPFADGILAEAHALGLAR